MKNQLLVLLLFICSATAFAQKGTVKGTITDKDLNNEPLAFSNVVIKGTTTGVTTDETGGYSISLEPGAYVIEFSFLGYETQTENITIVAGETITVNKVLGAGSYTLKDVVVQAQTNKAKESALLLDQKNAVEIKQNIGAQELSRKGVTDVATAVTKTSGVTKQEGSGNIYVRGLGDRYNSTTMNGLPIPSNNVENKNINLEIFSTDIVEYVSIDKVYSSKLYGDFAGGNVDIISKDYKGKGLFKIDIGSNANTNAISEDDFRLSTVPGAFGFTNTKKPANPLTAYNYESLSLEKKTPFAGSLGISAGDSYSVGSEGKLSFFATAAFGNEYMSITDGQSRGSITAPGVANKRFDDYRSYNYATNTTGMGNVSYKINSSNKINFNSLFINTSSQETEEYRGFAVDLADAGNGLIRRNTYSETSLFINQLLGEHKFGDRIALNWGVSFNNVSDDMPDRTQNIFNKLPDGPGYLINSQSAPNNHRYFQELQEKELAANISADYKFAKTTEGDYKGKLTVGYNGRIKNRDFEATQYNFKTVTDPISHSGDVVDPDNLDAFYNQANYSNNYFVISTFRGIAEVPGATRPQTYNGDLDIHAGLVTAEYRFSPKLTGVLGLRAEIISQFVKWDTQAGGTGDDQLDKTAILPNLIVKYELNEKQNLRFAFSKTYTLPQFKERALFVYEEVTQVKIGNPDLYESDNYNLDLKWEMFPKSDEVISLTAFGKYIQNPINEFVINSSTNDISWANTGEYGYAVGAEAEYRKLLYGTDEDNSQKLTAGLNVSYLYTDQELDSEKVKNETMFEADFTNDKGRFTGASDLLINGDVSYFKEWNNKNSNIMATIAYNYFSDRVYAIGTTEKGDLVDKAVGTLDLILKSKLTEKIGLSFSAKNILNPEVERVQENSSGDVLAQTYKKGMNLSLGINYQF